jgi:hypothetical protein
MLLKLLVPSDRGHGLRADSSTGSFPRLEHSEMMSLLPAERFNPSLAKETRTE